LERSEVMLDLKELKTKSAICRENFDFTVLTPLFMHGWQKVGDRGRGSAVNAELRGPSFRGILRYWWRSLQAGGHTTATLLKKEQAFFGGSSGGDEDGKRSPLLLKLSSLDNKGIQELNNFEDLCPHRDNRLSSLSLGTGRKLRIELKVLKKDCQDFNSYLNYCRVTFMLAGFGQRSRRGAGSVQLDGFNWTSVKAFQKELLETFQALSLGQEFNFKPNNSSCLIERTIDYETYPRLMRVWIGKAYATARDARKEISNAGHLANPGTGSVPQVLGKARGGRLSSPLLGTVRLIGTSYYPLISEMTNPHLSDPRYQVQRDLFLRNLGVSI